jgi:hypothetical protein
VCLQQPGEVVVLRRETNAIAVTRFPDEGEEQPQQRGKERLDVGRNHAAHGCPRLDPLHALVEARQRHDRFDVVIAERPLELGLGVDRVQWRHDGADLPGGELRDEELRAVGEQERDAIAARHTQRDERRCERVTEPLQRGIGDRAAFEQQCGLARPIAGGFGDVVEQGAVRIRRQRGRNARIVVGEPGRRRHHVRSNIVRSAF